MPIILAAIWVVFISALIIWGAVFYQLVRYETRALALVAQKSTIGVSEQNGRVRRRKGA